MTLDDLRACNEVGKGKNVGGITLVVPDSLPVKPVLPCDDVIKHRGFDKRLAMFGYTIETVTMLLIPMMKTK